jgi:uncharacterized repeat protein (TIGR01451 family)
MRRSCGAVLLGVLVCLASQLSACSVLPAGVDLRVQQVDLTPKSGERFKSIEIDIRNYSNNIARGIVIQDRLPNGFTYLSTTSSTGDAIRTRTDDPALASPLPRWGTWSLPAAASPSKPTLLRLVFTVTVGRDPGKKPNFVEVDSSDSDPVAAKPLVLGVLPVAVVDLQVSSRTPVLRGGVATYSIRIRNLGTAAAHNLFVSASLPPGFVYSRTVSVTGNALRSPITDPLDRSLLPSWGTWAIPPQQFDASPGLVQLSFEARVAADQPAGNYPISVTVTFDDLPAQTVSDQAVVQVPR